MRRLVPVSLILAACGATTAFAADPPVTAEAHATLQCMARAGWYWECKVDDEAPAGQGVAAAAVKLSACLLTSGALSDEPKPVAVPFRFQNIALPLAGGSVACASDPTLPAVAEQEIRQPVWLSRPNLTDLADAYPLKSAKTKVNGAALVECRVKGSGFQVCSVLRETPEGTGFGKAAAALAKRFRIASKDKAGEAVEGRPVRISLIWNAALLAKLTSDRMEPIDPMDPFGLDAYRSMGNDMGRMGGMNMSGGM